MTGIDAANNINKGYSNPSSSLSCRNSLTPIGKDAELKLGSFK
jgi:hypothetical protein